MKDECNIIDISKDLAIRSHDIECNHKYDGKPYSFHLQSVVNIANLFIELIDNKDRKNVLSACWLHDSIEDARLTYNDIKEATNYDVAELVYSLTNEKGKTRKERANDKYYEGIRNTKYASFIKACDRIANFEYSIISSNTRMALLYLKEEKEFIKNIYNENYEILFDRLKQIGKTEFIKSRRYV